MSKKNIFSYPGSTNNTFIDKEKIYRPNYSIDGHKARRNNNKLLNLPKKSIPRKVKW